MAIFARPKYVGTALPAVSETVTLYTTPALAGIAGNFFAQSNVHKVVLDLKNDQAGTLTQQKSADGGTTWVTISTESIGATGANDTVHREFPVEGIQDYRLRFANGGTVQGTFVVDVALSDNPVNYGSAGAPGAGGGAAILAADAMANPTEDGILGYNLAFNGTTWDRVRSGIELKQADGVGIINVLPMGVYDLTPDTLTDHDIQNLQLDVAGNLRAAEQFQAAAEDNTNGVIAVAIKPLAAATYSPSTFSNIGAATTATPKGSAGNLFTISAMNTNVAAIRYLQLFNSTSSTATVVYEFTMPPNSTIVVGEDFFTTQGIQFSVGITWGVSTTKGSYAAATAAEHTVQGTYL